MKPASGNIPLNKSQRKKALRLVEHSVKDMLRSLLISPDHNTKDTPRRVAKLMVNEVFWGRFSPRPKVTTFPNIHRLDQLYAVGPVQIRSACSHHLCPVFGEAWFVVQPGEKLIGLSKFARLADWVFARPHMQEEATVMLADELQEVMQPKGLGVFVKATHTCMTWRGVKEPCSSMVTSVVRGSLRENHSIHMEALHLIQAQGFKS